jgi:phosphoglucomutase
VWTTDKDGPIMNLLAAEITAVTGKDPGEHYRELTTQFGAPSIHGSTRPPPRRARQAFAAHARSAHRDHARRRSDHRQDLARAGQRCADRGIKVIASHGWFAARPSGTENIYKIYAESFRDERHLAAIVDEAQRVLADVFAGRSAT